jgi:Putative adhesin
VTVSAALIGGFAALLATWWATTSEKRIGVYSVQGSLSAISLDLAEADADIVGGGERRNVAVRDTQGFAFGHPPVVRREVDAGVLRISVRCPHSVLGECDGNVRLTVPDNVPLTVRTSSGDVSFDRYRGSAEVDTTTGDIDVAGYCGFALRARADSGDVHASATCAPERLELRSRAGDVQAIVPPGRYRLDADSDAGRRRVRGVTAADDAPFMIQALSSKGDVDVEAGG